MNLKFVLYLVGKILILVSSLPAVCSLVALGYGGEYHHEEFLAFLYTAMAMLGTGLLFSAAFRRYRSEEMRRRDGIGTVAFTWIVVCLFGALPFIFLGTTPAKAIFESVSGFTTTGASIYSDVGPLPRSILLWRSLTQWVGGIGILVLLVALLSKLGIRGRSLVGAESSVNIGSSATTKIKELAGQLLLVYLGLTVLCFVFLMAADWSDDVRMTPFEALCYTLATVSTGGFAPHSNSVAYFDSPLVEGILIVFMFLSSISFVLLYRTVRQFDFSWKHGSSEALCFLCIILPIVTGTVLDLVLQDHTSLSGAIRQAFFPIVSMATSTGYGTFDYDEWPHMSKVFLTFVMVIGGAGGSTAGGLKVIRFLLLLKILRLELEKTFRPNVIAPIRIDGEKVAQGTQYRALIYIVTVGFLLMFATGVVSVLEPHLHDFETAIGSVIATFFNMGPGFGDVGPTDHYGNFHSYTLLFLSWLMLAGRLEIFVLMALFTKSLWRSS